MGRGLSTYVAEHGSKNLMGGLCPDGSGMTCCRVWVEVGVDLEPVALSAASCRDVEDLSGCGRGDEGVGGVHRAALDLIRGAGVCQLDVLSYVGGRQGDVAIAVRSGGGDVTIVVDVGNGPLVAVLDPPTSGQESSVVLTGYDCIAGREPGPVGTVTV